MQDGNYNAVGVGMIAFLSAMVVGMDLAKAIGVLLAALAIAWMFRD